MQPRAYASAQLLHGFEIVKCIERCVLALKGHQHEKQKC